MKSEINIIQTSESYMYLVKSKALGYDFAEDWMIFWTLFMPIALILNILSKETILIYKGFLYIIFIFSMTLIRRNITSSFKYLLANLFIVFLTYIISFTLVEKIVFLAFIIIYFLISIKKRMSEVIEFYTITTLLWAEGILAICYFIAVNNNLRFMMNLITFASINIAITCALYVCISRMERLMEWEGEFVKGYSKRMKNIKLSCIAFINVFIIFFVLLAWRIGIYKLMDMLTSNILAFFNRTQSVDVKPTEIKSKVSATGDDSNRLLKALGTGGEPSHLVKVIFDVVQFIILAAICLFLIYSFFKLILKVRDFYRGLSIKKPYKKEKREFVISLEDVIEEVKHRAKRFGEGLELPFNMSNPKKIRKLYHKLIKSYKTKEVLASNFNTPTEIEKNIKRVLEKNISEATVIYEKARYSGEECSQADVDKMKSFLSS